MGTSLATHESSKAYVNKANSIFCWGNEDGLVIVNELRHQLNKSDNSFVVVGEAKNSRFASAYMDTLQNYKVGKLGDEPKHDVSKEMNVLKAQLQKGQEMLNKAREALQASFS